MKKIHAIVIFFFALSFCSHAWAQTQAEMYQTALADYKKVDTELNKVYNELRNTLSAKEKKLLTTAQKNWITYRDAHCAFEIAQYDGGSMQPLLLTSCKTACTETRIDELKSSSNRKQKKRRS